MVGESFLTHGLFPRGQGREDAGFGASHGHGAGIPVLVPSGCIWTAEKCHAEVRAWVPAAARLCSHREMLELRCCLGTPATLPNPEVAPTQPHQGLCTTLCFILGHGNESHYQWLPQGHSGFIPVYLWAVFVPLFRKQGGKYPDTFNVSLSSTLVSIGLVGHWSAGWDLEVLSVV